MASQAEADTQADTPAPAAAAAVDNNNMSAAQEAEELLVHSFSFAAAGWLKVYFFGVAKAIQCLALHKPESVRFAGASAGSLVATALILDLNFDDIKAYAMKCADDVRNKPFPRAFQLRKYVAAIVDSLVTGDAHEQVSGRIEVAVTALPFSARRYSQFGSLHDLKQVLLASCCMTPLAGMPFQLDGRWVIDGGLTDFQPLLCSQRTVTVSPFYFTRADVRPSSYVPAWWALYPPSAAELQALFELGQHDMMAWAEAQQPGLRRYRLTLVPQSVGRQDGVHNAPTAVSATTTSSCTTAITTKTSTHTATTATTAYCSCTATAAAIGSNSNSNSNGNGNSNSNSSSKQRPRASKGTIMEMGLDVAVVLFALVLLRPLCFVAAYTEMWTKSGLHLGRAALNVVRGRRAQAAHAWHRACKCVRAGISARLAVRTLVGRLFPVNDSRLHENSFFYRLGRHL